MSKRIVTLLAFVLVVSTALAQDYVVTLKGDTLKGTVRLLSFGKLDQVEVKGEGKKKLLTALEARTVFHRNETYHTVPLEGDGLRYMKLIKGGYLSLYRFRMPSQVTFDGVYLYKRTGKGIELPNLTFKKAVADFLEDCELVRNKIKEGTLGKRDIEAIVVEYNRCLDTKSETPVVIAEEKTDKVIFMDSLINRLESAEDFATRKDAIDILKDIRNKSSRNENIANYLIEGLKSNLAGQSAFAEDLEKVIASLQK